MPETIKVLFASGSEDLIPTAIEHMQKLFPELPLVVVSEFPIEGARWIPYPLSRSFWQNLGLFRWHFRDKHIRLCAVILQPRMPYWRMRLIAFALSPWNFLAFNEAFGHFMLRPSTLGTIARHLAWRTRNFFVWEFSPGGATYTWLWRLGHPRALVRPGKVLLARIAGLATAALKAVVPPRAPVSLALEARPRGVSVVIPSRNGRELLTDLLPKVLGQIERMSGEIIVVDNGSDDETANFLRSWYHTVVLVESREPWSFARAVNAGIQKSSYSHLCLLNNDMAIGEGFFEALLAAFTRVPDLFCATAQIFFPDGARREETGKAVMPFAADRKPADFPVRCEVPLPGEDLSYVLYGSGGCSLFDSGKLLELGGLDEVYEPAYVEDLDLGFRAWQKGWPSVFVDGARVVHKHRATTSRYYSPEFLEQILERNYLRFLARAVDDARVFRRLWREAVGRLNLASVTHRPNPAAVATLSQAWRAPFWWRRREPAALNDDHILAIGSGAVTVVPGCASRNRAVVVVATPYLPFPLAHGGAVRMYNLMRRAAEDFDQVLVSFSGEVGEVPAELLKICREVVLVKRSGSHLLPSTDRPDVVEEFDSPAFHAALRQTVRKWKPGVAQLEFTQMAQYAADCAPAKTILVEHDVTLDLYQQLLAQGDDWELRHQLERWIPFEIAAWSIVDRVVTMSEKDRGLTLSEGVSTTRAIALPNGVDLERFQPSRNPIDPRRLLFIGSFAHLPNVLAVDFFLREVWPRLQPLGVTLHIIAGARPEYYLDRYQDRVRLDLGQRGVELEDFVADVRPAYQRAAIVVAPLLASAGTNIKIMEAMAMGKAIVSTPAGINGLDLQVGKDVIVASTGAEMAVAIRELLDNPAKRDLIEQQARMTVERRFDWDVIAGQQKRMYEELMALA
ncbi:MAG TPA: glycosyltransferase [Bryobacteraceae bacterium]|nr:glycosyltransferase [Bryobacteraceae bacterium]